MLKVDDLKSQIQAALSQYIPSAIETCILNKMPARSKEGEEMAAEFAKTFDELVSEPLADSLANAIDYYVKNGSVVGQIITIGNKFTQTATISPRPMPTAAIPNTFQIK